MARNPIVDLARAVAVAVGRGGREAVEPHGRGERAGVGELDRFGPGDLEDAGLELVGGWVFELGVDAVQPGGVGGEDGVGASSRSVSGRWLGRCMDRESGSRATALLTRAFWSAGKGFMVSRYLVTFGKSGSRR